MPLVFRKRQRAHDLRIIVERVGGKKRFKIAGYYVNGRRVRRFFSKESHAKAFLEAERIRRQNLGNRATRINGALAEDALRAHDELAGMPYGVLDAARLVATSFRTLAPLGSSIDAAVDSHAERLRLRQQSVTVTALVTEFIENRRIKGKSAMYLRDLQVRLRRFSNEMGNSVVAELSTGDVEGWIQSLNVGPQTQNNFRAVLSTAWNFAVRRGYAATNILQDVERLDVVRDHVPVFSVEQLTALLNNAPPEYLPVIAIGAFAGLRPEEINKLNWQDIDFEEPTIRVNATAAKTRRKRFAEISENLAAWLRPYIGNFGPVAPRNLQKLRHATMRKAGIDHWPQDVLRHSFASAHYAFHRNPAHTAMLLGHRDQNMLLTHYRDLMKRSEAARYWKIVPLQSDAGKVVAYAK
jgi:integrase